LATGSYFFGKKKKALRTMEKREKSKKEETIFSLFNALALTWSQL